MGVLKEKPSPREGINNDLKIKRLIIIAKIIIIIEPVITGLNM